LRLVYRAWLLSRDERVLRVLCVACLGLAGMSYVLGKLDAVAPRVVNPSYERVQFSSEAGLPY
jgi:hypothetical protein